MFNKTPECLQEIIMCTEINNDSYFSDPDKSTIAVDRAVEITSEISIIP